MTSAISIINGKATVTKDPQAVLDYLWDWTDWLSAHTPADAIASAAVIVNNITLMSPATVEQGVRVRAWLGGGAAGQTATATCRITTNAGRVDDRTLYLKLRET